MHVSHRLTSLESFPSDHTSTLETSKAYRNDESRKDSHCSRRARCSGHPSCPGSLLRRKRLRCRNLFRQLQRGLCDVSGQFLLHRKSDTSHSLRSWNQHQRPNRPLCIYLVCVVQCWVHQHRWRLLCPVWRRYDRQRRPHNLYNLSGWTVHHHSHILQRVRRWYRHIRPRYLSALHRRVRMSLPDISN